MAQTSTYMNIDEYKTIEEIQQTPRGAYAGEGVNNVHTSTFNQILPAKLTSHVCQCLFLFMIQLLELFMCQFEILVFLRQTKGITE